MSKNSKGIKLPATAVDLSDNSYGQPAYVFYGEPQVMLDFLKASFGIEPKLDSTDHAATWTDSAILGSEKGKQVFFCYVPTLTTTRAGLKESMKTLVHETHHLVNFILQFVQVKVNPNNDEASAYLNEYFFGKCLDHILPKSKVSKPVVQKSTKRLDHHGKTSH